MSAPKHEEIHPSAPPVEGRDYGRAIPRLVQVEVKTPSNFEFTPNPVLAGTAISPFDHDMLHRPKFFCGYVVSEDDSHVLLVQSYDSKTGEFGSGILIPRPSLFGYLTLIPGPTLVDIQRGERGTYVSPYGDIVVPALYYDQTPMVIFQRGPDLQIDPGQPSRQDRNPVFRPIGPSHPLPGRPYDPSRDGPAYALKG